jgi:serine/threonine protein kinase
MSSDQAPPRGGSQLQVSRYRIVKHIASGGMGAVYLAYDPLLNRDVALKVLSPEMAARPNMVERFHREAKAAAKLRHENIVSIFDFGEASGTFFLAMEYVEGTDLEDYIEQRPGGRLDIDEAVDIAIQAAKALDHAAAQGIVHRDIKPSNFLVTKRGGQLFVKLTDMGLAREADDSRITRDNTTLGTVDYISPEQARDSGSADTRSDLYSLGCTIFHMLVGHGPFPKGNLIEKVQQHLSSPPPDVRFHRGDVPDHLSDVLFKLLAKDPYERYQTPLELIHDLMNPADFKEYLEATHELDRPTFTPPQHHARTINATVMLPIEDLLPPPDPLFPSSVDLPTADAAAASAAAVSPAVENGEMSRGDTVITRTEVAAEARKSPSSTAMLQPKAGDSVEEVELEELEEELEEDEEDVRLNAAFEAAFAAAAAEQKLAPPAKANGSHTLTRKPGGQKSTHPARPKTASPEAHARLKRMEKSIKKRETTRWIAIAVGGFLFAALLVWMIAGRNSGGDNDNADDGSPEVQPKRVLPKQLDKGKSVRPKSA